MSIRVGAIPPSAAAIGQSRGRTDTFLYGLILAVTVSDVWQVVLQKMRELAGIPTVRLTAC